MSVRFATQTEKTPTENKCAKSSRDTTMVGLFEFPHCPLSPHSHNSCSRVGASWHRPELFHFPRHSSLPLSILATSLPSHYYLHLLLSSRQQLPPVTTLLLHQCLLLILAPFRSLRHGNFLSSTTDSCQQCASSIPTSTAWSFCMTSTKTKWPTRTCEHLLLCASFLREGFIW